MDYEKKYKEALERARKLYDSSEYVCEMDNYATIFPELNESENEKIMKDIVEAVELHKDFTQERKEHIYAWLEKQGEPQDKGEISDGYHTFNELYYYRMLYNAAFFNMLPKEWVHKSKKHNDGEECFGGGWFIVMANLPTGQISNHYELKDWNLFQIPEKEVADKWDGHTPQEAADRLYKYLLKKQSEIFPIISNSLNIGKEPVWSEEDERKIVELKTFIAKCNGFNKSNRLKAFKIIDSLRPQSKQKWSEEDEKEFDCIINILDRLGFEEFCSSSRYQDIEEERFYYKEIQFLKRIKSLRPS